MVLTPFISMILVIVIGGIVGLIFDRLAGPGWLKRQIAGATRTSVTSALIGIAGAFIGFHLTAAATLGRGFGGLGGLVGAAIGAAVVLWLWRMVK